VLRSSFSASSLIVTAWVVLGLVVTLLGTSTAGASSQELVVVPGTCGPDARLPLQVGTPVDCFFRLQTGVDASQLANLAPRIVGAGVAAENRASCTITSDDEGPLLACGNFGGVTMINGTNDVTLEIGNRRYENAASFITEQGSPDTYRLVPVWDGREPVALPNTPIRFAQRGPLLATQVVQFAIAPRESGTTDISADGVLQVSPALRVDNGNGSELHVGFDVPPGRYRVWPCDGPACEPVPGGFGFQVLPATLAEVIPGHNDALRDRINIVMGAEISQTDSIDRAADLLGLNGPWLTDKDLFHGLFAIEPLASHRDRFNFWTVTEPLQWDGALADTEGWNPSEIFGLPSTVTVTLVADRDDQSSEAPIRTDPGFGGVRLEVQRGDDQATALGPTAQVLAHEMGHAIFKLHDEYAVPATVPGSEIPVIGAPNCAPDRATARQWWGDLAGSVDPFAAQVLADRASRGLPAEPVPGARLENLVTIDLVAGGCYQAADLATAIRPSIDSLMNSEIPVFGAVNRRAVQTVLDTITNDPLVVPAPTPPALTPVPEPVTPGAVEPGPVPSVPDVATASQPPPTPRETPQTSASESAASPNSSTAEEKADRTRLRVAGGVLFVLAGLILIGWVARNNVGNLRR